MLIINRVSYFSASPNYERIFEFKKGNTISISPGFGIGGIAWIYEGPYITLNTNYCFRKKSNNFEIGAGAFYALTTGTAYGFIMPNFHIGYKHQKPGKHFIVKTGLGFPKGISAGIGWAF